MIELCGQLLERDELPSDMSKSQEGVGRLEVGRDKDPGGTSAVPQVPGVHRLRADRCTSLTRVPQRPKKSNFEVRGPTTLNAAATDSWGLRGVTESAAASFPREDVSVPLPSSRAPRRPFPCAAGWR